MLTSIILLASICSSSSCDFYPIKGLEPQGTIVECQHKIVKYKDSPLVRSAREYENKKVECMKLVSNNDSYYEVESKDYGTLKLFK